MKKNNLARNTKIGILTFHDGINHGAFLQMYALYKFVETLGFMPEIINYKSYKHWKVEYRCFLWQRNPRLLWRNIVKIIKFKKQQKLLRESKFTFSSDKISEYDKIIIGSDEVWNYSVSHNSKVYFGIGLKSRKKIAYAPSFGSVSRDEIIPSILAEGIKNIDKVSVRDKNSMDILKNNFPKLDCIRVLDPTFLYNFDGEEILPKYDNYILLYTTGVSDELKNEIIEFSQKVNKKLIAIGYNIRWCHKNIISIDPFEWLGFFKNADMIITTMFHGTVFSIKYNKDFCTILEPYRINKIKDMLEELSLEKRIYSLNNKFEDVFQKSIDYSIVNLTLNEKISESNIFLTESLAEEV